MEGGSKMTREEKAKRYDDTIERAKDWYSDVQIGIEFKGNLEKLFPKLKESEDERIREALIALLKFGLKDGSAIAPGFNETKEQALAWLEKQGERFDDNIITSSDGRIKKAILIGLIDCGDAPNLEWSNFGGIEIDRC